MKTDKQLNKTSTDLILNIVEKYGGEDNREFKSELEYLKTRIEWECYKKVKKQIEPLTHFDTF